ACRKAIRSALATEWANGREQSRQNRHQHGRASCLVPDFQSALGGQVAMTTSLQNPARDLQTNVLGTFAVLEAARALSPEALITYSSTNKVYGDLEGLRIEETPMRYSLADYPNGLDESLPLDFSTPYGCSKGAADQYVRDWARVYGLKTVVFRHSSIFGGHQFPSFDQGWVGWFCQKAIEQKCTHQSGASPEPFTIAGTGKQVRDVLHAEDLISLYHAAYEHRKTLAGEIFNIGGGTANSLSLLELFALLSELLGIPPLIYITTPRRTSDQDCFIADISKAERLLAWVPTVSSREGVSRMLAWIDSSSLFA
ncbi:NAD-dependent epimerase/dehydratase family protein, partial [Cyanobium sp. Aljojuca 7D2]|uniref:NAD-dependent epimerase/dehydratase family protein n=1 Tax=Cyanobium sp. Aljojuca 7D2 TaxID=2823698 RepID=UPI0020CDE779